MLSGSFAFIQAIMSAESGSAPTDDGIGVFHHESFVNARYAGIAARTCVRRCADPTREIPASIKNVLLSIARPLISPVGIGVGGEWHRGGTSGSTEPGEHPPEDIVRATSRLPARSCVKVENDSASTSLAQLAFLVIIREFQELKNGEACSD